ncbi:MAG: hypothetical protein IJR63_10890 [Synergistaceae bacterium]|nr:hypothetical protein [Synergistaceae bacterium]
MSLKFTPSVWKVGTDGDILSPCADGSVSLVAKVSGDSDEARGNARLIASAPEMYWMLRNLLFELKRGNWSDLEYIRQSRIQLEDFLNKLSGEDGYV